MTPSDPRIPLVRPAFLKWSIVVFLLLMPFVAYSIWDYVETRRLRTRIEAIARQGAPTTALAYRPLTGPSTRAASYYQAAASLVSGYSAAIPAPIGYQLGVAARDGVWPQDLVIRARSLTEEHGEALSFADRAAALPFDGFNAGTTFNYLTGNLVGVSRLCALRANISALDGNADAAIASVFTDVKLARATRQAPSFSALAFVLNRTHPSSGALTRLADALAEVDRDDRFEQQLARLRARMLDESFVFSRAGTGSRLWDLHRFNHSLDVFSQLIAAAGTPPAERHAAVMAVGEWPIWWSRTVSGRATLESMLRASERETEAIRCARRLVAGEVVDCHF
jgi:hypothetical protein